MLVVGVGGDGGQVGLGQVDVIDLAVLVQLQAHGQVGDHGDGMMLETGAVVCSVVVGVVFMFFYIIEPKMEGLFGMVDMLLRYDNACFNDYADN